MTKVAKQVGGKQGLKLTKPSTEVALIMAGLNSDLMQTARVAAKAYGADARLNRYLASKDDNGLAFFVDKDRQSKIIESCNSFGYTSTAKREAAIRHALTQDVKQSVENEAAKVTRGLELNNEQKEALAQKQAAREKFIINQLLPGMFNVARHELGIVEDVAIPEKEAAFVNA